MSNFFKSLITNLGVVGEFLGFLWQRKLWWLIPMIVMLILVGAFLICAANPVIAPFIYTL